jgi:hypothetical protein
MGFQHTINGRFRDKILFCICEHYS